MHKQPSPVDNPTRKIGIAEARRKLTKMKALLEEAEYLLISQLFRLLLLEFVCDSFHSAA